MFGMGGNSGTVYRVQYDNAAQEWVLLKDGAGRAVRRDSSKTSLMPTARRIAKNNSPAKLIEEGTNGGTRNSWDYD